MKSLTRDLHGSDKYPKRGGTKPRKRVYLTGDNRRQVDERRRKFKTAGVPQIEDSHLLDGAEQDPEAEEIAAEIIAAACEKFKPNHWPAPERVTVVEEVEDEY